MGVATYREFLLELPSLLLFLLTFEFISPLLILGWNQNDGLLEEMGGLSYLKPFLECPSFPLLVFEFLPTFLLLRQSEGHSPGRSHNIPRTSEDLEPPFLPSHVRAPFASLPSAVESGDVPLEEVGIVAYLKLLPELLSLLLFLPELAKLTVAQNRSGLTVLNWIVT